MEIYTQRITEVRDNEQNIPHKNKLGEGSWTLRLTCKEHGTSGPAYIKNGGIWVIVEKARIGSPDGLVRFEFDSFEINPQAALYALVLYYTDQTLVKVAEPNWRRV